MLTLPPQVGRKYRYRNGTKKKPDEGTYTCEIISEERSSHYTEKPGPIYNSKDHETGASWTFWPDGTAKVGRGPLDHVAFLVEDVTPGLEELQWEHAQMMKRLEELQR